MTDLRKFAIKTSAEIDQEKEALWNATLSRGVPVLTAMGAGGREAIDALDNEQFALFTRMAKFGLSVVAHGKLEARR